MPLQLEYFLAYVTSNFFIGSIMKGEQNMEKRDYSKEEKKFKLKMFFYAFLATAILAISYVIFIINTQNLVSSIVAFIFFIMPSICYEIYFICNKLKYEKKAIQLEKYLLNEYKVINIKDYDQFKVDMLRLTDTYEELLPVEGYKEKTKEILRNVKFYAKISEKKEKVVEIFVQYKNDIKLYHYEAIKIYDFYDKYFI